MFKSLCDLATHLEQVTSEILDLERSSKIWKVRETSITDMIIASFRSYSTGASVEVDASNELATGADFEVIFRKGGNDLSFLFQAKRIQETKSKTLNIPELFHHKATGNQNKQLIVHATTNNLIPFYSIFLPKSAFTSSSLISLKANMSGIMVQDANTVQKRGLNKPSRNDLLLKTHLPGAFPFRKLFCEFEKAQKLHDIVLGRDDLPLEKFITDEIPLKKRRDRDEENLVYARILVRG